MLSAYAKGIFPMAHPERRDEIYWYAPDPRGLLPIDDFHCPRRLAQTVRQEPFEIAVNRDFEAVIEECSNRSQTWISDGMKEAYTELHRLGFAHSVEAWDNSSLVGGLYGVALGGLFAGESMFYRATDASKICLVHLARRLNRRGYSLFDIQFVNEHLEQFNAFEVSRDEYETRLARALKQQNWFA